MRIFSKRLSILNTNIPSLASYCCTNLFTSQKIFHCPNSPWNRRDSRQNYFGTLRDISISLDDCCDAYFRMRPRFTTSFSDEGNRFRKRGTSQVAADQRPRSARLWRKG